MSDQTSIRDRLEADYRSALKSRDTETVAAIRMLKAAIQNAEISKRSPVTEEEILGVLSKEAKVRRESHDEFERGGRPELAEREAFALSVLSRYMPPRLSEAEIRDIVNVAVAELTPQQREKPQAAMGLVMRKVMPQVSGRADGDAVNAAVRSALSGSS